MEAITQEAIEQMKMPGAKKLPYKVGQPTVGWYRIVAVALVALAIGAIAFVRQFTGGEIVTGMRDIGTMRGTPWGLYVSFIVYFVGVSFAGIVLAALIRLANLETLKPIARTAEVLTIVALLAAAGSVLADQGNLIRALTNLPRYARPMSPMFGTFTLVMSAYLFASCVYLYLDSRRDAAICARVPGPLQRLHRGWAAGYRDTPAEQKRHRRASFWLAIAILPLLITAHSTLGFVFGLQIGRPGWQSALQAPGFVVLAGVSGIGLLIAAAAGVRRGLNEYDRISMDAFRWLSNGLMVLILIYMYFLVVELLSTLYQGGDVDLRVTEALLFGRYAPLYWTAVACLLVPLGLLARQFLTGRYSIPAMVVAGILVNFAAILKRFVLVIASQTTGTLLPYGEGSYAPTWVEYGVVLGLFGLGTLLFMTFLKVFPIIELPEEEEEADGA